MTRHYFQELGKRKSSNPPSSLIFLEKVWCRRFSGLLMLLLSLMWLWLDWDVLDCLSGGCQKLGLLIAGSTFLVWTNVLLCNLFGSSVQGNVHILFSLIIYALFGLVGLIRRRILPRRFLHENEESQLLQNANQQT